MSTHWLVQSFSTWNKVMEFSGGTVFQPLLSLPAGSWRNPERILVFKIYNSLFLFPGCLQESLQCWIINYHLSQSAGEGEAAKHDPLCLSEALSKRAGESVNPLFHKDDLNQEKEPGLASCMLQLLTPVLCFSLLLPSYILCSLHFVWWDGEAVSLTPSWLHGHS